MLAPLSSVNDRMFSWLDNVFLMSFQDSNGILQKMLARGCLYHGKHMKGKLLIIETTQFLLCHQVKYALTERFCQDPLESSFGRQRSLGSRKDNL